jgi:hypothetical protein
MKMHANSAGTTKLWLLNLAANAAAIAAWYFWLLVPDARGWQVAGSALLAIAVIFLVVWLRAGTLAYFRLAEFREGAIVWPAFRRGLRHMIALALWFALLASVEVCLWRMRVYAPQFGVWLWQKLPGPLRIGTPRQFGVWTDWKILFFFWVIAPAIWLPMATTVAALGFRLTRMAHSPRVFKRPLYWLWFCALILVGVYVPYKLIWWVDYQTSLNLQAWSMGVRFLAAYVIVVTAAIALIGVTGWLTEHEDPEPGPQNKSSST